MAFTPPAGNAIALTFKAGPYTPPAGNAVALEFVQDFTPGEDQYLFPAAIPAADFGSAAVHLRTRYLLPPGVEASGIGAHTAWLFHRWVRPAGIAGSLAFGTASIINWNKNVGPTGTRMDVHGQPKIENKDRYLTAGGIPPRLAVGTHTIFNHDRYYQIAGFDAQTFGVAFLQGGVVTVEVSPIAAPAAPPAPWVSRSPRTLSPLGVFRAFPTNHMVGGTRWLEPFGFEATRWLTRIIPEAQTLLPQGFAGEYGQATVWNYRTIAWPPGFRTRAEDQRFGTAHAWNLRQYLRVAYDPNDGMSPPPQGGWTAITNRNRVITHHSTAPSQSLVPRPLVELGARALLPAGIEPPGWAVGYRAGMVAYRVRHLPLEGVEAPYFSGWSKIHNAAPVLAPQGTAHARYGTPAVANTRRFFPYITAGAQQVFGYPMVAPRVRTIAVDARYAIAPPLVHLPEAKLHTRYVDGVGYEAWGVGHPSLSIHRKIITPRWQLQHFFGYPSLRNLTPEVGQRGRNSEEFGTPFVRLQWRAIFTLETYTQRFGGTRIADRTQRVGVTGLAATTVSDKLIVTKTGAPPYTQQNIVLAMYDSLTGHDLPEGFGIPQDERFWTLQVPPPRVIQNIIYVRQDAASTRFGDARAVSNGIRVEPGYQELTVGTPWVSAKIRGLQVGPFPAGFVFEPSRARVSPHTIYAVFEAPDQAKHNHPVGTDQMHYVNSDRGYRTPGEVFGSATVRNRHRRITVSPSGAHTGYGTAALTLRRRYVRPDGIRAYRFGWHEIPGPKTLVQFDSHSFAAWGVPTVRRPPYTGPQTVSPPGFGNPFGANRIELWVRTVGAAGFDALRGGTRLANDQPYMWQGLRVGPLVPTNIGAGSMSAHGTAWVSLRVREVAAAGFDAFASEYDPEAFSRRMRVHRYQPAPPIQRLQAVGIGAPPPGAPDARLGARYIRPDGNADQYRKAAAGVS